MISLLNGYLPQLRLPSKSRGGKDLQKCQRALPPYEKEDGLQGKHPAAATSGSEREEGVLAAEAAASREVSHSVAGNNLAILDPRQLEARQQEEKEFIRKNDTAQSNSWYIIDVQWLTEWKLFVTKGGPLPGPIDNSRLVDKLSGRPRPYLEPVRDYRGVNAVVWNYWHERYGGGPTVRRRRLDLYEEALPEDLEYPDSVSTATGGASASSDPRLPSGSSPSRSEASSGASQPSRVRVADRGAATPAAVASAARSQGFGTAGRAAQAVLRGTSAPASRPRANEGQQAAPPTCDKCDGAHETDRCPHFKKPREKHADAWTSYGKTKSSSAVGDGAPFIGNAKIISQPGDGSCLFHSLAFGLADRSNASSLRRDICNYIASNPEMTIADTALKDWIKYDSGGTVQSYADRMRGDTWGGGIEMAALTKMRKVNVHVYEKCRENGMQGYRRISAFESPGASKTVSVLYQGRMHYDAIVV
eukprot:TRINITY_DN90731_c0_g1_i1.p1 TRINITY_DN90731_c0_g1~~TRINITY_DN90731_c0_g1_i1.p1  ORF type:complete len:475 (-),score=81.02 TRINITY_DN90731_c0_g1_i1:66-1490(-)